MISKGATRREKEREEKNTKQKYLPMSTSNGMACRDNKEKREWDPEVRIPTEFKHKQVKHTDTFCINAKQILATPISVFKSR